MPMIFNSFFVGSSSVGGQALGALDQGPQMSADQRQ